MRHGQFLIKPDFDENLGELRAELDSLTEKMQRALLSCASELGIDAEKVLKLEHSAQHGYYFRPVFRIRDSVPFDPWTGIRNRFFPDPIPIPYFLELSDNFLGKKFYNSLKTEKNKLIFNFVKFVATKKGLTTIFFLTPLFCCCFWMRDPKWVKIWIRDVYPGSATLLQAHHEGGEVGAERSFLYGDRGEQVRHQVPEQEAGSAGEWIVKQ